MEAISSLFWSFCGWTPKERQVTCQVGSQTRPFWVSPKRQRYHEWKWVQHWWYGKHIFSVFHIEGYQSPTQKWLMSFLWMGKPANSRTHTGFKTLVHTHVVQFMFSCVLVLEDDPFRPQKLSWGLCRLGPKRQTGHFSGLKWWLVDKSSTSMGC